MRITGEVGRYGLPRHGLDRNGSARDGHPGSLLILVGIGIFLAGYACGMFAR